MRHIVLVAVAVAVSVIVFQTKPVAWAQTDTTVLRSQIELLKGNLYILSDQFQELQQYVFTNGGGEAGANSGDNISSRRLEIVEVEMRKIEGELDELRNLIQRMGTFIEKAVADADFRLTMLESDSPTDPIKIKSFESRLNALEMVLQRGANATSE